MISSSNKNVEIKGNSMEVIEDFALIVFELQKIFGKAELMYLFVSAIAASNSVEGEEKS